MLRPILTLFVALCLLAHAAWPALPAYVCAGMGGIRLQAPCCPDEDGPAEAPAWAARCCEQQGPIQGGAQATPPSPHRPDLAAPVLRWQAVVQHAPPPPPVYTPPPRAGAPPGPTPRLLVLRI